MDSTDFKQRSAEMTDYVVEYLSNIKERRVLPDVEPGYLRKLLPDEAPESGEEWESIMSDVETKIMPGVTHWQHPRFHAYFPSGNSYPSILADMLSDAIGCIGFSWAASPACTELETVMVDWLGQMMHLPKQLLPFTEGGKGGGVIQGSASECTLVTLLAARTATLRKLKDKYPDEQEGVLLSKLVAYCSKQSHSSMEKAGIIAFVKMRQVQTDDNYAMRGAALKEAMQNDEEKGLIPFYVGATLGTTGSCAFDNVEEIGEVCTEKGIWLHVDGAYGGNALICPEFRHLLKGFEHVHSFNFNPNKWMLVNFDCSVMWVKNKRILTNAFSVNPLYLQHENEDEAIDYRHWTIPLSRRFRALKLWFVIRMYGVEGLRKYIRNHVKLAKLFESLVKKDDRFEVLGDVTLGLVCFRVKGQNSLTENLLKRINDSGKLHMVPANLNGKYVIRFAVCHQNASDDDITYAWDVILKYTQKIFRKPSSRSDVMFGVFMDNKYSAMHSTSAPLMHYLSRVREDGDSSTDEEKDDGPVGRLPRLFSWSNDKSYKLKNPPMRRRNQSVCQQPEGIKNLQDDYYRSRKMKNPLDDHQDNDNDNDVFIIDNEIPNRPPTLQRRMTVI